MIFLLIPIISLVLIVYGLLAIAECMVEKSPKTLWSAAAVKAGYNKILVPNSAVLLGINFDPSGTVPVIDYKYDPNDFTQKEVVVKLYDKSFPFAEPNPSIYQGEINYKGRCYAAYYIGEY